MFFFMVCFFFFYGLFLFFLWFVSFFLHNYREKKKKEKCFIYKNTFWYEKNEWIPNFSFSFLVRMVKKMNGFLFFFFGSNIEKNEWTPIFLFLVRIVKKMNGFLIFLF